MPEVPGSGLGKCSSISFSHVHIVIHCTQSSGRYDKWIRGWKVKRNRDRKRVRKEKKRVERKVGGGKGDFFGLFSNP